MELLLIVMFFKALDTRLSTDRVDESPFLIIGSELGSATMFAERYCNTDIKNNRDFSWNMNGWSKKKRRKWTREDNVGVYKKCDVQYGNGFHDGNFGPPRFW